jgi:hypothetical protein
VVYLVGRLIYYPLLYFYDASHHRELIRDDVQYGELGGGDELPMFVKSNKLPFAFTASMNKGCSTQHI